MIDIREGESNFQSAKEPSKRFLSVYWKCCRTYSHLGKDQEGKFYRGACPKCRAWVKVPIGEHGTSQRIFMAE